jgi:hypothetical protein
MQLGYYANNSGHNNIGDEGISLLIQKQLPLNWLFVSN